MLELVDVRRRGPVGAVLDRASFAARPGEPVAIVGASAAQRLMLGKLLAGTLRPEAGGVKLGGQSVAAIRHRRGGKAVAHVNQPWMKSASRTVRQTLIAAGVRKEEVAGVCDLAGLGGCVDTEARALPVEARVRLAVASACGGKPDLLVIDAPAAAVAGETRAALLADVARLVRSIAGVAVWLAADPDEALALDGRTAVLCSGVFVQDGPAAEVAAHPLTLRAAEVVSSPGLNTLTVRMEGETARLNDGATFTPPAVLGLPSGGMFTLAFLPQAVSFERQHPGALRFVVRAGGAAEHGDGRFMPAGFAGAAWLMPSPEPAPKAGLLFNAFVDPAAIMAFDAAGQALPAGSLG